MIGFTGFALAQDSVDGVLEQLRSTQQDQEATVEELRAAMSSVEQIVEKFPTSDAAVSILLGEPYDGIDFTEFERRLSAAIEREMAAKDAPTENTPAAVSCLQTAMSDQPSIEMVINFITDQDRNLTGLPEIVFPERPTSAVRLQYLKAVAALEQCAPFETLGANDSFQLKLSAEGLLSISRENSASEGVDSGSNNQVGALSESASSLEDDETAPSRSEEEIVLDLQIELNRLGCNAGSADGVIGRKTRGAFRNFIRDSGMELKEDELVSEETVGILKAQQGTVCKTRTMASAAASSLSGSWGFRGDCPGLGNRIVRNSGRMTLNYVGNNTLRGTATNQQGISGPATVQFQGARSAATSIRFGFFTLKGNLTRSTRNLSISGTGSRRCKISLWKN